MTEEEALRLLGLAEGATANDIDEAFKRSAKDAHPDTRGTDAAMSRLNEARDVALRHAAARTELVPISTVHELMRMQERSVMRVEARAERRERGQRTVQQLVRHETSALTRRKRQAQAVTALAGGATLITGLLRALVLTGYSDRNLFATLIIACGVVTAALGVIAWMTSIKVTQVEHLIEDASEVLSDRGEYFRVLHEIEEASDMRLPLYDDSFRGAVKVWIEKLGYETRGTVAALARRVGSAEFSRLLIAKGIELDVLAERVIQAGQHRRRVRYELVPTE